MSPSYKSHTAAMLRTNSTPGNFESSIDRPMRLAEIFVAAEHALRNTISNPDVLKSLSSLEEFEVSSLFLILMKMHSFLKSNFIMDNADTSKLTHEVWILPSFRIMLLLNLSCLIASPLPHT